MFFFFPGLIASGRVMFYTLRRTQNNSNHVYSYCFLACERLWITGIRFPSWMTPDDVMEKPQTVRRPCLTGNYCTPQVSLQCWFHCVVPLAERMETTGATIILGH